MSTFLRNNRRKLAADNNVIKYLRYAVGEILLVVIGILIALQVNTWNQAYKDSRQELFYLKKLQENIGQDTAFLRWRIDQMTKAQEELNIMIKEMKNPSLKYFSIDISEPLLDIYGISLETTTWENLKSTGKIDLIENKDLVDSLYNYYNSFNNQTTEENQATITYTRNTVGPFLMKFDDISGGADSTLSDLGGVQQKPPYVYGKSVFFRNIIRFRYGFMVSLISYYKSDNERASHLIHELSKEIQKSQ